MLTSHSHPFFACPTRCRECKTERDAAKRDAVECSFECSWLHEAFQLRDRSKLHLSSNFCEASPPAFQDQSKCSKSSKWFAPRVLTPAFSPHYGLFRSQRYFNKLYNDVVNVRALGRELWDSTLLIAFQQLCQKFSGLVWPHQQGWLLSLSLKIWCQTAMRKLQPFWSVLAINELADPHQLEANAPGTCSFANSLKPKDLKTNETWWLIPDPATILRPH